MRSDSESSSESESKAVKLGRRGTGHIRFSTTLALDGEVDREEILRNEERNLVKSGRDELRLFLFEFTEHRVFNVSILFVIFLNTIFIGLQTSKEIMAKSGWYLTMVDNMFLAIYIVEFLLKFYAWRLRYFKLGWNIFDFVIIIASFVDFLVPLIVQNVVGTFDTKVFGVLTVFRSFRALRALRVLRTIRFLKNLQIIVTTVLRSIPALGNIVLLISLVLYVFAIIGRGLYAEVDPGRFGNLGVACYTLFQLMTLDDWFYMYSEVAERHPGHRHIFIYLLLFIVLETFIFINLFVAVIVDNLEHTQAAASASKPKSKVKHMHIHDQESETDTRDGDTNHKDTAVSKTPRTVDIQEFYSPDEYTEKEHALRAQYLSLLASLEYHLHVGKQYHTTMEEMVDLLDIAKN